MSNSINAATIAKLALYLVGIMISIGLVVSPGATPTVAPANPQLAPTGPLAGLIIGIDPGHQDHASTAREPIAPGSDETKMRASSGTQGVSTGVPEYVVNLDVSLKLRDALEAQGATVVMARETNDIDISNIERAQLFNEAGCDLALRIHCNGSENQSTTGIGLFVRATGACKDESYAAAERLAETMVASTGARFYGIFESDNYTAMNWSEVPMVLVEMGFMSNPDEDVKLNDHAYQDLLVEGMVNGAIAYFDSSAENS